MRISDLCVAAVLGFLAPQAMAQGAAQDAAIDSALACRSIADPTARLACLDQAAAAIAETRIVRDDDSEVQESAPESMSGFGATRDKAEKPKKPRRSKETADDFGAEQLKSARDSNEEDRLMKIEEKVVEVRLNTQKRATLTLANGQTWRQLASDDISLPLRDGKLYTVVVKRGAIGNYLMTVKELKRTIRVRRIR